MDPGASPQIVGRYAIYGRIASGGMASVHFGRLLGAAGFSRTVAVKRLHAHLAEDPQFISTMIDEARLAARIHHPNVVPTLDAVAANGELLVVMEYVRGESLARLLVTERGRERQTPLAIASAILIGALHGLHAAHEATSDRGAPLGIVHRDVSPQNILVGVDGIARVIDFGVAKAAGRLQTTSDGAVKGKVAYMAPEQLAAGDPTLAAGEVTRAADIYAAGAVLWEMLAGRRLFSGEGDAQLILQVLMGVKEPPSAHASNVPAALDALVMRALSRNPASRFASAKEMAEALLRVVPPAFPTNVGKWVESIAGEALERRGTELARIESRSETVTLPSLDETSARLTSHSFSPPTPGMPFSPAATWPDDAPTVASQPSSLSVETPRPLPRVSSRPQRGRLYAAVGASMLLALGGGVIWQNQIRRDVAVDGRSGASIAPLPPPPAASAPRIEAIRPSAPPETLRQNIPADAAPPLSFTFPPTVVPSQLPLAASAAPATPPRASASADAADGPGRSSSKSHSKSHSASKPSAPFRFSQPD